MQAVTTFLMFNGQAEEAMNFYTSLIENSSIVRMNKFGNEGPGKEGTVMHAIFSLNGTAYMCIDSIAKHDFGFTPSVSIYVTCKSDEEISRLYSNLSGGGQVFMELGNYGFSTKFGWIQDKFGVSWQLNLP